MNELSLFATNPQFNFRVESGDSEKEKKVFVSLMQKHRRALRDEGETDLTIGFSIYKREDDFKVSSDEIAFPFLNFLANSWFILGK